MTRALVVLSLVLACAIAHAAVPNRGLTFVAIPTSDAPLVRASAAQVAAHAQARLGLNPGKIYVAPAAPTVAQFTALFTEGEPFQAVSHDDLVVVFLAGAHATKAGIKLPSGVLPWAQVYGVRRALRRGPGGDQGFFGGAVLVVLDQASGATAPMKGADLSVLTLRAPKADTDLIRTGRMALGAQPTTAGAAAWAGAVEALLRSPDQGTGPKAIAHLLGAKLQRPKDYAPRHHRLLLRQLRVGLSPRLVRNPETLKLLDQLQRAILDAAADTLGDAVKVERTERPDPSADIRCQVVANAQRAHIECVEGRAPIFSDRLDVTQPAQALKPVVRQILRDYTALAATDWAARRRELRALDVVALIDTSLSMAYHDPTGETDPALGDAPSKREVFLLRLAATLSAHAGRTGRPARLTALLFGDTVAPLKLPGGDANGVTFTRALTEAELAGYAAALRHAARPQAYTAIAGALSQAAVALASGDPKAARHVVLLTDGRERVERADPEGAVRRAARAVQGVGATLSCVGLTEQAGRLPQYLAEMRAGGPVLRRYIRLLDMRFAPRECRRDDTWDDALAQRCGTFYADLIERGGAYDPAILDDVRRSDREGVPTGLFLQPDNAPAFQRQLQALLSVLTGGGIYATRGATRTTLGDGQIQDTWRFDLDLSGRAKLVLYNGDGLRHVRWRTTRDGRPVTEGVRYERESDAVTVVHLPSPARGVWRIERTGKK